MNLKTKVTVQLKLRRRAPIAVVEAVAMIVDGVVVSREVGVEAVEEKMGRKAVVEAGQEDGDVVDHGVDEAAVAAVAVRVPAPAVQAVLEAQAVQRKQKRSPISAQLHHLVIKRRRALLPPPRSCGSWVCQEGCRVASCRDRRWGDREGIRRCAQETGFVLSVISIILRTRSCATPARAQHPMLDWGDAFLGQKLPVISGPEIGCVQTVENIILQRNCNVSLARVRLRI